MVEKNPVVILSRATLSLLDFRKSDFFENVWHRSEFFYSLGNNQIVIVRWQQTTMLSYFLLEVGVVVKYQLVESGYALFGERNEEYFLMQGNFERKNAIIIGSIIKQVVTNEGGQFSLENNGVVYI